MAGLPAVAFIDEPNCIGCALCLQVCPTDAILGAAKQMHTVIVADCTGCKKCVPVCPTDCITMQARPHETAPSVVLATRWRLRINARKSRLEREKQIERQTRQKRREALRPA